MVSLKCTYLKHKYQVYNDKHHWPKISRTTEEFGAIFHLDYSENLTQSYKNESQSSHFNKGQYSPHCSVKHSSDQIFSYFYCLSDDLKHNFAFTKTVVDDLLEKNGTTTILPFKSDNCSVQYKCKNVFSMWQSKVTSSQKQVIIYYGVSSHGKGLVDAMSGFGVKGPLRKAAWCENFSYSCADDITKYLVAKSVDDDTKHHVNLNLSEIRKNRDNKNFLKINGCMQLHMICFSPNGNVTAKVNLRSCDACA